MLMNEISMENAEIFAATQSQQVIDAIKSAPGDSMVVQGALEDLKVMICRRAAQLSDGIPDESLVWGMAHELPSFDTDSLYHARASLLSLGAAVVLGWLAGGFLSTVLGFMNLGGEIIRPAVILAFLWLEDYLAANARARKIMLTVLGFGALVRFASTIIGGISRLAGMGGLRQLIFGAGPRPGLFKTAWLWIGAFFIYVFFAKKITALDLEGFRESLEKQIIQKCKLMDLVFQELAIREKGSNKSPIAESANRYCSREDCVLARAALSLVDSLEPDQGRFLASALASAGYYIQNPQEKFLTWDNAKYKNEYEPLGMIADGDRALILEHPHKQGENLVKGRVQRVAT